MLPVNGNKIKSIFLNHSFEWWKIFRNKMANTRKGGEGGVRGRGCIIGISNEALKCVFSRLTGFDADRLHCQMQLRIRHGCPLPSMRMKGGHWGWKIEGKIGH